MNQFSDTSSTTVPAIKSQQTTVITKRSARGHTTRALCISVLLASTFGLSACNEYWRTRGQPPSVQTLMERSQSRLADARTEHEVTRTEVSEVSKKLEASLLSAFSSLESSSATQDGALLQSLGDASAQFLALEGKVSIGSRAAFGELAGQMRTFSERASKGEDVPVKAFGLFAARTMFFLANELQVPAPSFG